MQPTIRSIFALAVLALSLPILTPPAAAAPPTADPPRLFLDADPLPAAPEADERILRQRVVRVDFTALDDAAERATRGRRASAGRLTLNLFPGFSPVTELDELRSETPSSLSWVGHLIGERAGQVTLVWGDGVLVGHLWHGDEAYRIRYLGGDLHVVEQLDPAAFPAEAEPIVPPQGLSEALSAGEPELTAQADSGATIDVLVVYTAAARSAAGGTSAIQSEIAGAISDTNTAFSNSNVVQRVNLIHTAEVDYDESGSASTVLGRLRNTSDGHMDTVHALRDIYRADLVALVVSSLSGACGIGYLMQTESTSFASNAFSVTDRDCFIQYTLAHEMGHNMGSHHDPANAGSTPVFSYSYGYQDATNGFRTVMAYPCAGSCPRIRHWSDDTILYMGHATGDADQDNARSLNNVRTTVANFRDSGAACSSTSKNLCMHSNRFEANVTWYNPSDGARGIATSISDTSSSGYFWFFGSSNVETALKILDGTSVNGKYWLFHGSLTGTEYTLRVRDTTNKTVKTYTKAASSYCGAGDTGAFALEIPGPILEEEFPEAGGAGGGANPEGPIAQLGSCTANTTTVCLLSNRFAVRVKKGGVYQSGDDITSLTGIFWFVNRSTPEVVVKTLDGTGINGNYWVFYGSLTDQSYQVEVTDTVTSTTNIYTPPASLCGDADLAAF